MKIAKSNKEKVTEENYTLNLWDETRYVEWFVQNAKTILYVLAAIAAVLLIGFRFTAGGGSQKGSLND